MRDPLLMVEKDPGLVTLTLNNPAQRNAMTLDLVDEFKAAIEDIKADPTVLAVIITGAGKGFSSGADINSMIPPDAKDRSSGKDSDAHVAELVKEYYLKVLSILDIPAFTIAAINGAAVGAGCALALACDMRIAADDAKLILGFVKIGLHPGMASTRLLPPLVGMAKAYELMATGEAVTGAEAERIGLVNKSVPRDQVMIEARALALKIANGPAIPLRRMKRALRGGLDWNLAETLDYEARAQVECMRSADMNEGITAFMEHRTPKFEGR